MRHRKVKKVERRMDKVENALKRRGAFATPHTHMEMQESIPEISTKKIQRYQDVTLI